MMAGHPPLEEEGAGVGGGTTSWNLGAIATEDQFREQMRPQQAYLRQEYRPTSRPMTGHTRPVVRILS